MFKKNCFLVLCVIILMFQFSLSVFANDNVEELNDSFVGKIITKIVISDPETGEVWESVLPDSDINYSARFRRFGDTEEILTEAEVSLDIIPYLDETGFRVRSGRANQSSTRDEGMEIKTGLVYTTSQGTFGAARASVSSVFGSTTPRGYYYATDRRQNFIFLNAGIAQSCYPSSNSWSFSTKTGSGNFGGEGPPTAALYCTIRVSGMTAYRNVSIFCILDH